MIGSEDSYKINESGSGGQGIALGQLGQIHQ